MIEVKLPELGEGIEKAVVACWHVDVGQKINEGDDLVELVTDKAVFNVSSENDGVVNQILYKKGQEVKIGEVLGIIKESE